MLDTWAGGVTSNVATMQNTIGTYITPIVANAVTIQGATMTGALTTPQLLIDQNLSLHLKLGNPLLNLGTNSSLSFNRTNNTLYLTANNSTVYQANSASTYISSTNVKVTAPGAIELTTPEVAVEGALAVSGITQLSGSVNISGTAVVNAGLVVGAPGINLQYGSASTGILFQDGTIQTTAYVPSSGSGSPFSTSATPNHVFSTQYTNSYGKTMLLVIGASGRSGTVGGTMRLLVNGSEVMVKSIVAGFADTFTYPIVAGQTYQVNSDGNAILSSWREFY